MPGLRFSCVSNAITQRQLRNGAFLGGLRSSASLIAVILASWLAAGAAAAQESGIITAGDMAVSGFSGTRFPSEGIPPGVSPIDETMISLEGASLRVFNISRPGQPPSGQLINLPPPFEVPAGQIGQVFGLAFDDGIREETEERVPNLYATATTMHGLQIVTPDSDGDGRPERAKIGAADARFMDGQWGEALGGGPGSIWKIDGLTGEATLFANIGEGDGMNSGPALGNIAFDPASRHLYVSDLDTGLIHRFNLQGEELGTFDHGVDGRPTKELDTVADDGVRMEITSPGFTAADPKTWGFTDPRRQVHGLGVYGGRLYYAVRDGLQIWSVGLEGDGSFSGDVRWELDVKSDTDHAVTDIAFDRSGFMYLAQRGNLRNDYDYLSFAEPAKSLVLRYWRENPDDPATESEWVEVPQEYAVGFPAEPEPGHRMSLGGIDLGYGYDRDGNHLGRTCDGTIAITGDALRLNEALADKLAEGGPFAVHGVQLNDKDLVRPKNEPPFESYFVDYDGRFDDPEIRGHVGDVEIWRPCIGQSAGTDNWTPYPPPPVIPPVTGLPPCFDVEEIQIACGWAGELQVNMFGQDRVGINADSMKIQSKTPGVFASPLMQTRPDSASPFFFDLTGWAPGEKVQLGMCAYNSADAAAGGTFPCCKFTLPIDMPEYSCAP